MNACSFPGYKGTKSSPLLQPRIKSHIQDRLSTEMSHDWVERETARLHTETKVVKKEKERKKGSSSLQKKSS